MSVTRVKNLPKRATNDVDGFVITDRDATACMVRVRGAGRTLAVELDFPPPRVLLVTTVISELARNILMYARTGTIALEQRLDEGQGAVIITASDQGPGIADLERALMCGYSTSGSPGCGLSGINRMADAMSIVSQLGSGTTVKVTLWRHKPPRELR